jgi:isopenicillin-N N-acyltransferase like protein
MLEIHCSGTPYEIGLIHGRTAKSKVHGSLSCYSAYFAETAGLDWSRAKAVATQLEPSISSKWPSYLEEMRGIADGAEVSLASILALNVRTEIAIGLMREDRQTDGCTTLSWRTEEGSWLAQN